MRRFKIPFGVTVFVAVWLIAALVSPLRESLRVWRADHDLATLNFGPSDDDIAYLKARYPSDPRVLAEEATLYAWGNAAQRREAVPKLDALIVRFPDQQWIRALRLVVTVSGGVPIETGRPSSFSRSSSQWLDRSQLEKALRVAREAEQREPENSFWPLTGAAFSFGLHRSAEGLEAVSRAAKCRLWNDYRSEDARHRIEARSLAGVPTWEEKVALSFTELYPHYSVMRDVALTSIREGRIAMRRGDHKRALQIFGETMDASQVVQKGTDSLIGVLVGQTMERFVWDGVAEENGAVSSRELRRAITFEKREKTKAKTVGAFAVYARKWGRDDLASRAIVDAKYPWSKGMSSFYRRSAGETFGVSELVFRVGVQGPWLVTVLGSISLLGAAIWLLGLLLNRYSAGDTLPSRGQITGCANFSLWSSLICFSGLLYVGIASAMMGFINSLSGGDESAHNLLYPFVDLHWILIGLWLLPVAWVTWRQWLKRPMSKDTAPRPFLPKSVDWPWIGRVVFWGLSVAFLIVLLTDSTEPKHLYQGTPLQWPLSMFWFVLSLGAALVNERNFSRRAPESSNSFLAGLLWAISFVGTLAFFALDEKYPFASGGVALNLLGALNWASLTAAIIVGASAKIRQIWASPQRSTWLFGPRLACSSAGVLSVIFSMLYLITAITIWPPRAQLNRALERRMQMGEVAWIHDQIAANPNPQYR